MKKQINVYAYFAKNLGDDQMVDIMAKRFPRYNFYTEREIKNPFLLKNKNFKDRCFYKNKYEKIGKLADKLLKKEAGSYADSRIKKIENKRFCSVLIGRFFKDIDNLNIVTHKKADDRKTNEEHYIA